jgi:UDP-N-acetylglucosamine--N-acetylmuramyl-(pentapeptide) pyrophosphoryl-undecaprenol N-acetylglucosamine transferase
MPKAPRLLITGGGTGGHVSPGLGVAQVWRQRYGRNSVSWVGRKDGIEERMAKQAGLPFLPIEAAALKRRLSPANLALPWTLLKGLKQGQSILKAQAPVAVLMTGGYVGMPLSLAAARSGVPLVLLEPNAVPGLANRLLKPLAKAICLAYPPKRPGAKDKVTGTPCRLKGLPARGAALKSLKLSAEKRTLLILPGSLAARSVNAALKAALPRLKDRAGKWQWIWMCGAADLAGCQAAAKASGLNVQVKAFVQDVATAYAAADLMLCRSGASTLAELGVAGMPSLQVPYPHATGDHQRANARAFAQAGAAKLLEDRELGGERLEKELRALLDQAPLLKKMSAAARELSKPGAAGRVTAVIEKAAGLR